MKHGYLIAKSPDMPSLRQVHLMHEELLDELRGAGFTVQPGAIGENVTTRGVDLLRCQRAHGCGLARRP